MEVAERIAAPQRSSTRTIYKSKWALFEKWCRENSVDFSTPSVKQVSVFFMYLYQDLNRRPSTIDGYRTAIVDTLGPAGHHISQSSYLKRLLSSFHLLQERTHLGHQTCYSFLLVETNHFIALIHPIQWTIALPVGATGPAKRQKKTSCIYYRQDRSQSVHSPGGASYFISCLPLDVIASFSFGAKECAEDFLQRYVF